MRKIRMNYLLIVLTILIQSCNEQEKKVDALKTENDYTLLMYGLPDMERQNSRNIIAEKWAIKFKSVAGCVVSKELVDSVKTINDRVNKNIEKKYGKNWNAQFEKEIGEEYEKEKQITAILDKVDFIRKRDDQMDKEGNGLVYYMTPIENSTTDYKVSVEGWDTINDKDVWVSYYRMTANYKTKEYKLLEDKIEKIE
ncbi:hypothetical protein [Chryseobacterium sp. OV279]|uniref:FEKKY domain-containing protein n=1 Tax=Chryseobacterium sp. OV279 TaxID=1500285 RepID=UPI0009192B54|nr:hypothetical protein [Chryseobacterium sp. OV279]SHF98423.1 hypothetical protein SAMN02787100_3171 [Chryseobacterium sp. OV279]